MSNRKDLKHSINCICQGLLAECIAASLYSGNADKDNVDALLGSILNMQRQFVSRIGHPEPGLTKKAYFDNSRNKLTKSSIKSTTSVKGRWAPT